MSRERTADGARVASGRLRVDAARAVDKLREYQLPDRSMWILEVVRAAVLAGAARVRVHGDADDVVVSWDGPAIDAADLARLFDELVDPAPDPARRHLRLLGTGVNTALGLDPRWVDLIACDGSGAALAVRYTPRLLERGDDGTARGLRELEPEPRVAGPLAPARGMLVHVRRLPMLGALPILIGIGEPAELSMVRRACSDASLPIGIGRATLGRDRSHGDLLRVALGDGLDGFLAITDPSASASEACLDVAELGVLLARYTLPIDGLGEARAKVPLRAFVDAARMPTNASRSAVRLDEPPVRDAIERAADKLPELAQRLANELGDGASHDWSPHQRERLRAAALSLIAAAVAGQRWRSDLRALDRTTPFGAAVARLAELPLARDAIGRPRAPAGFAPRAGSDVVHVSLEPAPEALEPWLGEVLWIPPGDPASTLLGEWRAPTTKALLARVRAHRGARERWLEQEPGVAEVPDGVGQLLAVPLRAPGKSLKSCAPSEAFAPAVKGQLVLRDPRSTRTSAVVLRTGGRVLERLSLDLPLPIACEVEHEALRPSPDYQSVERDEVFDAVLGTIGAAVAVACEALALRLVGHAKQGDRASVRAEWIERAAGRDRAAIAEVLRAGVELVSRAEGGAERLRASRSPLLDAEVWPSASGWRPLRAILEEAKRTGAIAFVRAAPEVAQREEGRTLYALSAREQASVAALIAPAPLVDYEPALARGAATSSLDLARQLREPGSVALRIESGHCVAAIAWTASVPQLEVRHWGRALERKRLPEDGPRLRVIVDDERVVPSDGWRTIRPGTAQEYPLDEWHRELARAFADALSGDASPMLALDAAGPSFAWIAREGFLRAVVAEHEAPEAWLGSARVAMLRRAPIAVVLGGSAPVSLDEVATWFPGGAIPYVEHAVSLAFDLGDFRPLVADALTVAAFARLLGRELVSGATEIDRRKRGAAREVALHRHRLGLQEDPARGWPSTVTLAGTGFRSGVVALAAVPDRGAEIVVTIERRRFLRLERAAWLPVRLAIDLEESAADEDFRGLTERAEATIAQAISRGARALLRRIAKGDPSSLVSSPAALALLGAWADREVGVESKLAAELRAAPAFPTVQGAHAALDDAATPTGVLRVAAFDQAWLGPEEGERESAYDRAVVRLPSEDTARERMMSLLEALWSGAVRDVSAAVIRLQTERRIARGLAEAPRLESVKDPRFRYSLDALLANDTEALEGLGVGEAALADAETSRIQLFEGGVAGRAIDLNLIPRVVVAASSPLVIPGRTIDDATRERLRDALRAVTSNIMRRAVDETPPDQLPDWLRRSLRLSCLHGGATHYARLAKTPMFETTTGAWIAPDDLLAQAERFGAVWWTSDLTTYLEPLDPQRVALRLPEAHAALLAGWIEVADGAEELALDARARRNRERPPVGSLEPSAAEREAALGVIELAAKGDERSHGVILILRPERAATRGLHLHREMRPLGAIEDPCAWPALARVEDPGLTPNRTEDGAEEDVRLAHLKIRVRSAVARELARLIPFPTRKRFALRASAVPKHAQGMPKDSVVEGVAYLEDAPSPGTFVVHDALGQRELVPTHDGRVLPISGTLWTTGELRHGSAPIFTALARELLRRVASQLAAAPDASDPLAVHLVNALTLLEPEWTPDGALPCFAPAPWSLRALVAHVRAGGVVCVAGARHAHGAFDASATPVLVDDGSPVATHLVHALGTRAVAWRPALRAHVLEGAPLGGAADAKPAPKRTPLELALDAALERAELPGVTSARVVRRAKPSAHLDASTLVASLPRTAGSERAAPLLVARGAGAARRDDQRIDARGELEILARLLDAIAEADASE